MTCNHRSFECAIELRGMRPPCLRVRDACRSTATAARLRDSYQNKFEPQFTRAGCLRRAQSSGPACSSSPHSPHLTLQLAIDLLPHTSTVHHSLSIPAAQPFPPISYFPNHELLLQNHPSRSRACIERARQAERPFACLHDRTRHRLQLLLPDSGRQQQSHNSLRGRVLRTYPHRRFELLRR